MDALTVVGAGGIGCAVGYFLRAAGVRVTFVDADGREVRDSEWLERVSKSPALENT